MKNISKFALLASLLTINTTANSFYQCVPKKKWVEKIVRDGINNSYWTEIIHLTPKSDLSEFTKELSAGRYRVRAAGAGGVEQVREFKLTSSQKYKACVGAGGGGGGGYDKVGKGGGSGGDGEKKGAKDGLNNYFVYDKNFYHYDMEGTGSFGGGQKYAKNGYRGTKTFEKKSIFIDTVTYKVGGNGGYGGGGGGGESMSDNIDYIIMGGGGGGGGLGYLGPYGGGGGGGVNFYNYVSDAQNVKKVESGAGVGGGYGVGYGGVGGLEVVVNLLVVNKNYLSYTGYGGYGRYGCYGGGGGSYGGGGGGGGSYFAISNVELILKGGDGSVSVSGGSVGGKGAGPDGYVIIEKFVDGFLRSKAEDKFIIPSVNF